MTTQGKLQVLVVDDSALVRQAILGLLSKEPDLSVTVAADPIIAMDKMKECRPAVIILDLEMPRMDGLTFLRKLMAEDPIPTIVCSASAGTGSEMALRALAEGAVDVIGKPRLGVRDFSEGSSVTLPERVRAVARAKVQPRRVEAAPRAVSPRAAEPRPTARPAVYSRLVAIGASLGGPDALRFLLQDLPANSPPLIIVQHMAEGFTGAFARNLAVTAALPVTEAIDGQLIVAGHVLVAPASRHLRVARRGTAYYVELEDGPRVSHHKPSVDVFFQSVAESVGPAAVGVILTGMGNDGAIGILAMRRAGAITLAQDEASSVVFGMPERAIAAGGVSQVVPLNGMPDAILSAAARS